MNSDSRTLSPVCEGEAFGESDNVALGAQVSIL